MGAERGTRRIGGRALSAVAATAILAVAGAAFAGGSAASPSASQASGFKFRVVYKGSFEASWRSSRPVQVPDQNHTFRCEGDDSSGTLTSSVRPGSRPFFISFGHELGGPYLHVWFRPPNGGDKGIVTSNRTAQGWLMRYSGHQCIREEIAQPGCGGHTVTTDVMPFSSITGGLGSGVNPLYRVQLAWPLEPETIGCSDGIFLPTDYDYGWRAVAIRGKTLYRCGIKKGRRCKVTIGRDRTYVFDKWDRGSHYETTVHVKWSLTFIGAGRG
jgi:hypothetical protein